MQDPISDRHVGVGQPFYQLLLSLTGVRRHPIPVYVPILVGLPHYPSLPSAPNNCNAREDTHSLRV